MISYCVNRNQACIIALLNGYIGDEKSNATHIARLQTLERAYHKHQAKPLSFLWIDAICHNEIIS